MDVGKWDLQEIRASDMFIHSLRQLRHNSNQNQQQQSPSSKSQRQEKNSSNSKISSPSKRHSKAKPVGGKINTRFIQSPLPPIPVISAELPIPSVPAPNYSLSLSSISQAPIQVNPDSSLTQLPMTSSLYSSWNPPNFLSISNNPGGGENKSNTTKNMAKDKQQSELIISTDSWRVHNNNKAGSDPLRQRYPAQNNDQNYMRYHKTFSQPTKSNKFPFSMIANGGISNKSSFAFQNQGHSLGQRSKSKNLDNPSPHPYFLSFRKVPSERQRNATINTFVAGINSTSSNSREFTISKNTRNGYHAKILSSQGQGQGSGSDNCDNYVDVDEVDLCLKLNSGNSLDSDEDEDEEDEEEEEEETEDGNRSENSEPVYECVSPFNDGGDLCAYSIPMKNLGKYPGNNRKRMKKKKTKKEGSSGKNQSVDSTEVEKETKRVNGELCSGEERESLSFCSASGLVDCNGSGGGGGSGIGVIGSSSGCPSADLVLRTQLRDQVMQDGINISRISDEGILRSMAAQYAAELASTLTLTPSSHSTCSSASSSGSSCLSGASGTSNGSESNCYSSSHQQTPADLHYDKVFHQLRELWLEERMKVPECSRNCGTIKDEGGFYLDTTVVSGPANGHGNGNGNCIAGIVNSRNVVKSTSCSSTPAVTTPCDAGLSMAQCLTLNPNSGLCHHHSKRKFNINPGCISGLSSALSVPCLLPDCDSHINSNCDSNCGGLSSNNNKNNALHNSNSQFNTNSDSNSPGNFLYRSPERFRNQNQSKQQQQQHQYLQHVIISNSSFGDHQTCHHNSNSNSNHTPNHPSTTPSKSRLHPNCNNNLTDASSSSQPLKQNYTPGIYLPSSCLRDKDEIYDYAPPIRLSPSSSPQPTQRSESINLNYHHHQHQNHYSPSDRCFVQPKCQGNSSRNPKENPNVLSTIRGSSKSSYALSSSSPSAASPYHHQHNSPGSNSGDGVKTGCTRLSNLSRLSRRLGLSRFFRTLRIHGGNPASSIGCHNQFNPNNSNVSKNSNSRLVVEQSSNANGNLNVGPSLCNNETPRNSSYDNHNNAECERIHFIHNSYYNNSQTLYKSNGLGLTQQNNNSLHDLTRTRNGQTNGSTSISSLPSNERIIETINRLKQAELERRKEKLGHEFQEQRVRDSLIYMLARQ